MRAVKYAEYPFTGWKISGPNLNRKEGRMQVVLRPPVNTGKPTCMAYAKYLLSVKLGRVLTRYEQADHIDGNKANDSPDNLQVLTREQNIEKYAAGVSHTMVTLLCPECNKIFTRRKNQTHLAKHGVFTSCSRKCCGIIRQKLQSGNNAAETQAAIARNVLNLYAETCSGGSTS